jgi:hypothetical protein
VGWIVQSTWLSLGVPGAEMVWVLMVVLVVVAAMQTVLLPSRLLSTQLINHKFIQIKSAASEERKPKFKIWNFFNPFR